jgi:hypothetical protein
MLVDTTVQVMPPALDLDVGLVHQLGAAYLRCSPHAHVAEPYVELMQREARAEARRHHHRQAA